MAVIKNLSTVLLPLLLLAGGAAKAQEFNCTVEVLTPKIQKTNKQIFTTMQTAIQNFMNATKFTQDKFNADERIDINLIFNLDKMPSQTEFGGSLQIITSRPVYGTSYNTTMLRVNDKNIEYEFKEYQPLQYVDGAFSTNLTSILAFYAYMALGLDYDSFSPLGGTAYFNKALDVVNAAQTSGYTGWEATAKGRDNRYWLVYLMLDEKFKPLRNAMYTYHRLGFDTFTKNLEAGRAEVLKSLEDLQKVHKNLPNSYLLQVIMDAKRQEIIDLFGSAPQSEKTQVLKLIESIDVSHISQYQNGLNK